MLEYLRRFLQRKTRPSIPVAHRPQTGPNLSMDQVRDAVLFIGRNGRITGANQAALCLYGYSREELLSMSVCNLRSPETAYLVRQQMEQALHEGIRFESVHVRKDGTHFHVEVTSNALVLDSQQLLISIIRDISDRKRREAMHTLLREIDQRLLHGESLDRILNSACEDLAVITNTSLVWVSLKESDGSLPVLARGGTAVAVLDRITIRWDHSPQGADPTGRAVRSGSPQMTDLPDNPDVDFWRESFEAMQLRRGLCVPLNSVHGTLGVLTLYSTRPDSFDDEVVADLAWLADEIAVSLLAAERQERVRVQRAALEASACAMVIASDDGRILWVNSAWSQLTGYTLEAARDELLHGFSANQNDSAVEEARWQALRNGQSWKGQVYSRRKDGSLFIDEQVVTPVRDERGVITHLVAVTQDVTDRALQQDRLRYLALHDPDTGAPNSRALRDRLDEIINKTSVGIKSALLLVDLDCFREVNEKLGYQMGSAIMGTLTSIMRQEIGPSDLLARWDSDRFCALLEDVSMEEALATAERLRAAVEEHRFVLRDRRLNLTASIGLVPIHTLLDQESVLTLAEWALNEAKLQGRNRTMTHDSLQCSCQ